MTDSMSVTDMDPSLDELLRGLPCEGCCGESCGPDRVRDELGVAIGGFVMC